MEPAQKLALTTNGQFLLTGLQPGTWKYLCIRASDKTETGGFIVL